jgi:hypothetical protein
MKEGYLKIVILILTLIITVSGCGGLHTPEAELKGAESKLAANEVEVLSMQLSSSEVVVDDIVTVTAMLYNAGEAEGNYNAVLQLDGNEIERVEIMVGKEESETVTFEIQCTTPGVHELCIGTAKDTLIVKEQASTMEKPIERKSLDYFPIEEGYTIMYHVTDELDGLDCMISSVSVAPEMSDYGTPDFDFYQTQEVMYGGSGRYPSNCLGGDISRSVNGYDLTCFWWGHPSSEQGNLYNNLSLPYFFESGDEWEIQANRGTREYAVEHIGLKTVSGIEFDDCIRVEVDDSSNVEEYLQGTGYFILAKNVGIVKMVFERTSGETVIYEYVDPQYKHEKSDEYLSLDYFPIEEGHGIKYHVTDDDGGLECDAWAISQHYRPDLSYHGDFMFTLIGEGDEGDIFHSNSLGGTVCSREITLLQAGYPSSNQGHFYRNYSLPLSFETGDDWEIKANRGIKKCTVEHVGLQTVGGTEFADCIRINIDDSDNSREYERGTGHFILAKDIGIVKLVFTRDSREVVEYEYIEHKQFDSHLISGTIKDEGEPLAGICVQLANGNWGTRSITDSTGSFKIRAYGPDVVLRIGYDKDNNDVLDFGDPDFPVKEFRISEVTSDILDLIID